MKKSRALEVPGKLEHATQHETVGGVVVERPHVSLVSDASAALSPQEGVSDQAAQSVVNDILNRFEKRVRSAT